MQAISTGSMADVFVAAAEEWTRRAHEKVVPDFYRWCLAAQLLGTEPGQFKPVGKDASALTDPQFASGASVSFIDGSVAVRDLDELQHGRCADWRVLPTIPDDLLRLLDGDS